jgi:hypothetical protein
MIEWIVRREHLSALQHRPMPPNRNDRLFQRFDRPALPRAVGGAKSALSRYGAQQRLRTEEQA